MRKNLIRFVRRILDARKKRTSFEADFDRASDMLDMAVALRLQGFGVRWSVPLQRLYVSIPVARRVRAMVSARRERR